MQICFDTKAREWRNISLLIATQLIRAKSSSGLGSVRKTFNNLELQWAIQCFLKGSTYTLLLKNTNMNAEMHKSWWLYSLMGRNRKFLSWDRALSSSVLNAKKAIKQENWIMDHLHHFRWRNKLQKQTRIQMICKKYFLNHIIYIKWHLL